MSSVTAPPGGTQATHYLQRKGLWFWASLLHEGMGNLQVKWNRGRTPPGQRCPDYAGDIHIGVGLVNDYQFVQGLYLDIADCQFPLFLCMARRPRCSNQTSSCTCWLAPASRVQWTPPSVCAPCRMPATGGPVADPSCKHMMWQEGENGPVTFQVQNMMFWGVDGSHSTGSRARCVGT